MKNIQYSYLEWCRYGRYVNSIEDRLLRFESATDRDYWEDRLNGYEGSSEARNVESNDPFLIAKYDFEDFYTDRFKEGDRCPSGHFYYEIPPRESFMLEN